MARGRLNRRVKLKPTPHLVFKPKAGKHYRKVSHYAEFTYKDTICGTCNTMSEIHKEPRRCHRHLGGVYT